MSSSAHTSSRAPFWQEFLPGKTEDTLWHDYYDAPMPDGTLLRLPLRDFGEFAIAGFIANQASFVVLDRLVAWIVRALADLGVEVVVGLPTIGHVIGAGVARELGLPNWVAAGTTRKLWYDERLSVATHSVTSPELGRRMWLDPRLLYRLTGRRVLLVDDVVSSGNSARAGVALLRQAGIEPVGLAVAMIQGNAWRGEWNPNIPVRAAFDTPAFRRAGNGWQAIGPTSAAAREI